MRKIKVKMSGNPSDKCAVTLKLRSTAKIMGLPAGNSFARVNAFTLDDLTVSDQVTWLWN